MIYDFERKSKFLLRKREKGGLTTSTVREKAE